MSIKDFLLNNLIDTHYVTNYSNLIRITSFKLSRRLQHYIQVIILMILIEIDQKDRDNIKYDTTSLIKVIIFTIYYTHLPNEKQMSKLSAVLDCGIKAS